MRITSVSVGVCEKKDSKILGLASITLDNSIVLNGFKIMDSVKGLFVSNPSYKTKEGEFKDIFFIMNKKDRELIHKLILDKYIQKNVSTMEVSIEEDLQEVEQNGECPF